MRKKKNNFIRKALVFASVFIILLVSCTTVIFAQAPNYEDIVFRLSTDRLIKIFYFYDGNSNNLLATFNVDYITDNVEINACNFVFSDYYYENYFTGNVDNDFLSFSTLTGYVYVVGYYANQSLSQSYFNDTTLYSVISTRGITSALYSQNFKESYNDQLAYWNYYKTYFDSAHTLGYSQAIEDYDMFEKGLFTIFNAPFVFVQNIVGFEIFGITLIEILMFILILCLGYVLIKFIGGAIPL